MLVISYDNGSTQIYFIKETKNGPVNILKTTYCAKDSSISRVKVSKSGRIFVLENNSYYLKELELIRTGSVSFNLKKLTTRLVDSIFHKDGSKRIVPRTSERFLSRNFTFYKNCYKFKTSKSDLATSQIKIDETRNILYHFVNIINKNKDDERKQWIVVYDLGVEDNDFAFRFQIKHEELFDKVKSNLWAQFGVKNYTNDYIVSFGVIKRFVSENLNLILFTESGIRIFLELDKKKKLEKKEGKNFRVLDFNRPYGGFEVKFIKLQIGFEKGRSFVQRKVAYGVCKFKKSCFLLKYYNKFKEKVELAILKENFQKLLELKSAFKTNHVTEMEHKETVTAIDLNTTERPEEIWSYSTNWELHNNKVTPFDLQKKDPLVIYDKAQNLFLSANPFFKQLFFPPDTFVIKLPSKLCKVIVLRPIDRYYTVMKYYFYNQDKLKSSQSPVILDEFSQYITDRDCDELLLMLIQLSCQPNLYLYYSKALENHIEEQITGGDDQQDSQSDHTSFNFQLKQEQCSNNLELSTFILKTLLKFKLYIRDINPHFDFVPTEVIMKNDYGLEKVNNLFVHGLILYQIRIMR